MEKTQGRKILGTIYYTELEVKDILKKLEIDLMAKTHVDPNFLMLKLNNIRDAEQVNIKILREIQESNKEINEKIDKILANIITMMEWFNRSIDWLKTILK